MKTKYWFLSLMIFGACKDKYMPEIHSPVTGYLVVEGFINAGNGPTTMTLTRASGLDSIATIPEHGALVEIQSANGAGYPLTETTDGNYTIPQVPVDPSQQYRLHIKTANGKEYLSDLTEVRITPPIDSVSWNAGTDEVGIYVSTHDALNKSIYYQWQYEETWQYGTPLKSFDIRVRPLDIESRTPAQALPVYCWSSDISTNILIGTTAALSQDNLYEFPLTKISYSTTDKLSVRYSILVKQFVLTKDWYNWQQKIKKNTEQLGSIFDPQPSEVDGNIHSVTDPGELVVGFIGCTTMTEQRIFINRSDIPVSTIYTGYQDCFEQELPYPGPMARTDSLLAGTGTLITGITRDPGDFNNIIGVMITSSECVDCRIRGGTDIKPDFW